MDRPLEIFFSYAHEDEDLMNDVRRQLIVYERNGRILKWHDRMISPGTEWRERIDSRPEAAQVVLLFMSPHFIESRYCYEIEGEVALRKLQAGEARVLPIILRPCPWEETPFGAIQALPAGAKPISRWADRDEACLDAARGVMKVVDELAHSRHGRLRTAPAAPTGEADTKVKIPPGLEALLVERVYPMLRSTAYLGRYVKTLADATSVSEELMLDFCNSRNDIGLFRNGSRWVAALSDRLKQSKPAQ
jgi:hypothetical protein